MKKINSKQIEKLENKSNENMKYRIFENENSNENLISPNSIQTIDKEFLNPMEGPLNFFDKNENVFYLSVKENNSNENLSVIVEK